MGLLCSNTYFGIRIDRKCHKYLLWYKNRLKMSMNNNKNVCIIVCEKIAFRVINVMKEAHKQYIWRNLIPTCLACMYTKTERIYSKMTIVPISSWWFYYTCFLFLCFLLLLNKNPQEQGEKKEQYNTILEAEK